MNNVNKAFFAMVLIYIIWPVAICAMQAGSKGQHQLQVAAIPDELDSTHAPYQSMRDVINTLDGAVRNGSIAPIEAIFSRYESKNTSTKTLAILVVKKAVMYNQPEIIEYMIHAYKWQLLYRHIYTAAVRQNKLELILPLLLTHCHNCVKMIRSIHAKSKSLPINSTLLYRHGIRLYEDETSEAPIQPGALSSLVRPLPISPFAKPILLPTLARPVPIIPCNFMCSCVCSSTNRVCGKIFATQQELAKHMHNSKSHYHDHKDPVVIRIDASARTIKIGSKYYCSSCDAEYNDGSNCQKHINKSHLGIRKKCPFCEKSFTTKTSLRNHCRSQHNQELY